MVDTVDSKSTLFGGTSSSLVGRTNHFIFKKNSQKKFTEKDTKQLLVSFDLDDLFLITLLSQYRLENVVSFYLDTFYGEVSKS